MDNYISGKGIEKYTKKINNKQDFRAYYFSRRSEIYIYIFTFTKYKLNGFKYSPKSEFL